MKPPYVEITAECSNHGRFMVQRKPNKNPGTANEGGQASGLYCAVKCPKCPWWATIIEQKLVELAAEVSGDRQGSLL
jgi:hypothetical protein